MWQVGPSWTVRISDQIGVGSHKVSWPTIVWAVVSKSCPCQARNFSSSHVWLAMCFAAVTGMDQLSQRDQMQVMQALNEMQMQERDGKLIFCFGQVYLKMIRHFQVLYMSSFRNACRIIQVVSVCFGLLPEVLPYRVLTGDDEYLQQLGREMLQRMCHKLSHQGELQRVKRQSLVSLIASGQCCVGLLMELCQTVVTMFTL